METGLLWGPILQREATTQRIREALLSRFDARVRRLRRFEIELCDATDDPNEPSGFVRPFERAVRPLLEQVKRCLAVESSPDPRTPDWLRKKWETRWNALGARPAEWTAGYVERKQGGMSIRVTPETLDDMLFWWWVITQPSTLKVIPLTPLAAFDADSFFRRGYDPQVYGGSRGPLLPVAKDATAGGTNDVAFLMTNNLTTTVVASTPNVTQLFRSAIQHAALTQRLQTLAFVRHALGSEEL